MHAAVLGEEGNAGPRKSRESFFPQPLAGVEWLAM